MIDVIAYYAFYCIVSLIALLIGALLFTVIASYVEKHYDD